MTAEHSERRGLLLKDGIRRVFSADEMRRMQYPTSPADWGLRLLLRKSQRPRLLLDGKPDAGTGS